MLQVQQLTAANIIAIRKRQQIPLLHESAVLDNRQQQILLLPSVDSKYHCYIFAINNCKYRMYQQWTVNITATATCPAIM